MTVGTLLSSTTSYELTEWMMYHKIKNQDWEKEHKSPQRATDPAQVSNELTAAMKGYKR